LGGIQFYSLGVKFYSFLPIMSFDRFIALVLEGDGLLFGGAHREIGTPNWITKVIVAYRSVYILTEKSENQVSVVGSEKKSFDIYVSCNKHRSWRTRSILELLQIENALSRARR